MLTLIRKDRPLWDYWDAEATEPYGEETVYVVTFNDDVFEFASPNAAHAAMSAIGEAEADGRSVFACTWTVELTGDRRPYEVDFPSDLVGPCNAVAMEDTDGLGWTCFDGHGHRSDLVYYEADEVAAIRDAGGRLATNAVLMDGSAIR